MKTYPQKITRGPPATFDAFFGDRNYRHVKKPNQGNVGFKVAAVRFNWFWQQVQKKNQHQGRQERKIPQLCGLCVWSNVATLEWTFSFRPNTVQINKGIYDRRGEVLGLNVGLCGLSLMWFMWVQASCWFFQVFFGLFEVRRCLTKSKILTITRETRTCKCVNLLFFAERLIRRIIVPAVIQGGVGVELTFYWLISQIIVSIRCLIDKMWQNGEKYFTIKSQRCHPQMSGFVKCSVYCHRGLGLQNSGNFQSWKLSIWN